MKILVNGVHVPLITNRVEFKEKLRGIPAGSILIIAYNCDIDWDDQKYAESRDVKIVRQL